MNHSGFPNLEKESSCEQRGYFEAIGAAPEGAQVVSTRIGISFLTGIVNNDGASILKSDSVAGMKPVS